MTPSDGAFLRWLAAAREQERTWERFTARPDTKLEAMCHPHRVVWRIESITYKPAPAPLQWTDFDRAALQAWQIKAD